MTKKTASEGQLNALHGTVAKVLVTQLEAHEMIDVDGVQVEISTVTPAMVAQAIKFLKDNNITTTIDTDENLTSLKEVLDKKRKRGSLHLIPAKQAASEE